MAESWLTRHQESFSSIREIGSTEAIRECVLAGLGVAVMSEKAVQRQISQGLLSPVATLGPARTRQFFLSPGPRSDSESFGSGLVAILKGGGLEGSGQVYGSLIAS